MDFTILSIIASVITSLTVIISCIVKMYKLARKVEEKLES